jgi:hypothetical protein
MNHVTLGDPGQGFVIRLKGSSANLIALNTFKQCFEISFAESFIIFPLNEFKKNRTQ